MSGLRDYERWHEQYDDPGSDLSWRLATVQGYLRDALDRHPGQLRVLSACSGDGRDVLGVLGVLGNGSSDSYAGAVPADLVLLVGIFGNISDADLDGTIGAAPQFCRPGATVLWSRGRPTGDRNDSVRGWFTAAGFTELDYATLDTGSRPAVGMLVYDGPAQPLTSGCRLFTFLR